MTTTTTTTHSQALRSFSRLKGIYGMNRDVCRMDGSFNVALGLVDASYSYRPAVCKIMGSSSFVGCSVR
jgi:hypothetical protein